MTLGLHHPPPSSSAKCFWMQQEGLEGPHGGEAAWPPHQRWDRNLLRTATKRSHFHPPCHRNPLGRQKPGCPLVIPHSPCPQQSTELCSSCCWERTRPWDTQGGARLSPVPPVAFCCATQEPQGQGKPYRCLGGAFETALLQLKSNKGHISNPGRRTKLENIS